MQIILKSQKARGLVKQVLQAKMMVQKARGLVKQVLQAKMVVQCRCIISSSLLS